MPAGAQSTDPGGDTRVETTRVLDVEAQMEYRSQFADEREAAVRNHHANQRDVQRNEPCEDQRSTVPDSFDVRETWTRYMSVSGHRIPMS